MPPEDSSKTLDAHCSATLLIVIFCGRPFSSLYHHDTIPQAMLVIIAASFGLVVMLMPQDVASGIEVYSSFEELSRHRGYGAHTSSHVAPSVAREF